MLVDRRLWDRLVYSNLAIAWFDEFERYWVGELGLRPITPLDFHFLRGIYRQRFQTLLEVSDANALEEGWRDARSLYLLFHLSFKNALRPLADREYLPWIHHGNAIMVFGCGLAPIASSLVRFYRDYNLRVTCADIEHLFFHYVRWKFKNQPWIRTIAIDPCANMVLDDIRYDTILCMTVLEHVPRPVQTLKSLHACLNPEGYLIFDYIKSEGKGLDSESGLRDRIPALQFVRENFDIVSRGDSPGWPGCRKDRMPSKALGCGTLQPVEKHTHVRGSAFMDACQTGTVSRYGAWSGAAC